MEIFPSLSSLASPSSLEDRKSSFHVYSSRDTLCAFTNRCIFFNPKSSILQTLFSTLIFPFHDIPWKSFLVELVSSFSGHDVPLGRHAVT